MIAYHGSLAKFDRFDLNKCGLKGRLSKVGVFCAENPLSAAEYASSEYAYRFYHENLVDLNDVAEERYSALQERISDSAPEHFDDNGGLVVTPPGWLYQVSVDLERPLALLYTGGRRVVDYADAIEQAAWRAKSEGMDGLVIRGLRDPAPGDVFVAFKPDQVTVTRRYEAGAFPIDDGWMATFALAHARFALPDEHEYAALERGGRSL